MKKVLCLTFATLLGFSASLPALAADGYNLTVYVFTGSADKTKPDHKAVAYATVSIPNRSSQTTNTAGETTFTNVPPSATGKTLKITVMKSGCDTKFQGYKMPKYNAKVGIQLTCTSR